MNWGLKFFSVIFCVTFVFDTFAHEGGLDVLGCHLNKVRGDYHCHLGLFVGQKFSSKGEVITLSQSDKKQPTKQLRGTARIVDGDTIWIGDTKIRLYSIDAPETGQECFRENRSKYHCGRVTTGALRILVGLDPVRCEGYAYDRYDRLIATCYSGSINLNAELVRQGWALAYRRYSKDYIKLEKEAQDT